MLSNIWKSAAMHTISASKIAYFGDAERQLTQLAFLKRREIPAIDGKSHALRTPGQENAAILLFANVSPDSVCHLFTQAFGQFVVRLR